MSFDPSVLEQAKHEDTSMITCPPTSLLKQVGSDTLDQQELAFLETHLESCKDCQDKVVRLLNQCQTADDTAAQAPSPQPGLPQIPGYTVLGLLARGLVGAVYRARQHSPGREVAIKLLPVGSGTNQATRKMWQREAKTLSLVRHPNVVTLYSMGEHDGYLYLVLDYIKGGSLEDRISDLALPPRIAAILMKTVAEAVQASHQAGVLHLDIKPANILINADHTAPYEEWVPMVGDFGIARLVEELTVLQAITFGAIGTPLYASPEQATADRRELTPKSDIFSMGSTLYRLLTGRPPFMAATAEKTREEVKSAELIPPSRLVPGIPPDLDTIVETCLQRDPERRYASARALAEDLDRWLNGFPIHARPIGRIERLARWTRRHPTTAVLIATLGTVLTLASLGFLVLWRRAEFQRQRATIAYNRLLVEQTKTSTAIQEIFSTLQQSLDSSQGQSAARARSASQRTRQLLARLRENPDQNESLVVTLRPLQHVLTAELTRLGEVEESSALSRELLKNLTVLQQKGSSSPLINNEMTYISLDIYMIEYIKRDLYQCHSMIQRIESLISEAHEDSQLIQKLYLLEGARTSLAGAHRERNEEAQARQVLIDNLQTLRRYQQYPEIKWIADLDEAQLNGDRQASIKAVSELVKLMSKKPIETHIDRVSFWLVEELKLRELMAESYRLNETPTQTAHRIDQRIKILRTEVGDTRSNLDKVVWFIKSQFSVVGAQIRREGRFEESRQLPETILALSDLWADRISKKSEYWLLRTIAYEQSSKYKWKQGAPDLNGVIEDLRLAVIETKKALNDEPDNRDIINKLEMFREKLSNLITDNPQLIARPATSAQPLENASQPLENSKTN